MFVFTVFLFVYIFHYEVVAVKCSLCLFDCFKNYFFISIVWLGVQINCADICYVVITNIMVWIFTLWRKLKVDILNKLNECDQVRTEKIWTMVSKKGNSVDSTCFTMWNVIRFGNFNRRGCFGFYCRTWFCSVNRQLMILDAMLRICVSNNTFCGWSTMI